MSVVKVVAFTVAVCVMAQLLKQYQPAMASLFTVAGVCLICMWCVQQLTPVYEWLGRISTTISADFAVLLRCTGVAVLVQLSQAVCKDSGQTALAAAAEMAGRILILLCAIPLLQSVLSMVLELMQ